jgi:hypothetical protein
VFDFIYSAHLPSPEELLLYEAGRQPLLDNAGKAFIVVAVVCFPFFCFLFFFCSPGWLQTHVPPGSASVRAGAIKPGGNFFTMDHFSLSCYLLLPSPEKSKENLIDNKQARIPSP